MPRGFSKDWIVAGLRDGKADGIATKESMGLARQFGHNGIYYPIYYI